METVNARDLRLLSNFLPSLKDKTVLQLGSDKECTNFFSKQQVKSVCVVDSNEDSMKENKEFNSKCSNINYSLKMFKEIQSDGCVFTVFCTQC